MKIGDKVHVKGFTYIGPILKIEGKKFLVDCKTCQMWVEESAIELEKDMKPFLTFPIKVKVPRKEI